MASDHNAILKDLRPLNVARTITEEPHVAATSNASGRNIEGYFAIPSWEPGSPGTMPVFYPATMANAGYAGLGYAIAVPLAPGAPAWRFPMPVPVGH